MPRSAARRHLNKTRGLLRRIPTALLKLMARLSVAAVFFRSGQIKLDDWPVTLELFTGDYAVPLLPPHAAAVIATAVELGASTLLALGLFARFAASALLGMILVVQLFVYPENWPDHAVWATLLIYVLARGPGAISVDRAIARNWLDRE